MHKFDHLGGHLTTAVEHSALGDHHLGTADSSKEEKHVNWNLHGNRAQEFHWTLSTVEQRIPFHKMQKGELIVYHCQKWRGFTPFSRHMLLPLTCVGSGSHKTPL